MNAANEEAVAAFLKDKIRFVQIADVIEESLMAKNWGDIKDVEDIFETEKEARDLAKGYIVKCE